MAAPTTAWGVDIGQCALKALKLREVEGELQVEAFDIIEHPDILSQPDANRQELIRNALEQFLARNNIAGATLAISVPGQSSFTRFVKLPPVEPKKIPDIVRFEAEQQIPFPIEEVIWRWQTFHDPDSPDVEVGIFAMKRSDIADMLDHFTGIGIDVDCVQMAPLALYNFMTFDEQLAAEGATLLADVRANKTDLVVADGPRIWTRTIQIGGNNFTEALVKAFKLSFAKAEKLKCTAATSKYARQIFQAMRPVFADLVQEIQRSVGYYTSLHRETRFRRLVGLGNGFRLPGLQKFLEQNLNIPVVRVDSYNRLRISSTVNVPVFTENVLSFAVAYGLALQGLRQTRINTNLLPTEIARKRLWAKKQPWFVAIAAAIIIAMCLILFRNFKDRNTLADTQALKDAQSMSMEQADLKMQYRNWGSDTEAIRKNEIEQKYMKMFGYRSFWPSVQDMISRSIADDRVARDQKYFSGDESVSKELRNKPRSSRRIIIIEKWESEYSEDLAAKNCTTGDSDKQSIHPRRGFEIVLTARTPLPRNDAFKYLINPLINTSVGVSENIKAFEILGYPTSRIVKTKPEERRREAGREEKGPRMPDPYFPDEDMSDDTRFEITWKLVIKDDGVDLPAHGEGLARP